MRDFLQTAGFLHVRNVFSADEIATMRDEVERLRSIASPDDGKSWFAKNRDGEQVCCRLIYLAQRSAQLATVAADARLHRLAALSGEHLRPTVDRLDGVSVVIKNPDVVEGLSDLPWHQDCGLGGHPVLCPALNIGIQLDVASAANGQLRFLAGSHRHTIPVDCFSRSDLPIVSIDAEPGDVTVHFGHVSHEAPPPQDPAAGRRALYVGFASDRLFDAVPEGCGYNDVLLNTPGQPAPAALS
jgi:ectoine hydroxylase-related dioxygenase (phytanoyl-CoA dioxygenase family)